MPFVVIVLNYIHIHVDVILIVANNKDDLKELNQFLNCDTGAHQASSPPLVDVYSV